MNNADWQHISVMYTVDAFMAAKALNNWPALARPIVHWFMPECKRIRGEVKIARALIVLRSNVAARNWPRMAARPGEEFSTLWIGLSQVLRAEILVTNLTTSEPDCPWRRL